VLARFCRLFADPNREPDAPDLARPIADGFALQLNRAVDAAELEQRLGYWRAYHGAVDAMLARTRAPVALAIHTFTPLYEGQPRSLEVGVLFDQEEALARRVHEAVAAIAWDGRPLEVRDNEPYSGKLGLMYSVARHARAHGRRALELEVRQDLACDPAFRARLVAQLVAFAWT